MTRRRAVVNITKRRQRGDLPPGSFDPASPDVDGEEHYDKVQPRQHSIRRRPSSSALSRLELLEFG